MSEVVLVALGSLRANKLRSLLTMLGIVIGIAAVIAVVGLGMGAQRAVNDRLARLGTRLLQVNPQRQRRGGVQWGDLRRLTIADAAALDERGRHFAGVQPQIDRDLQVVYGNRNTSARVTATTSNFLAIRGFQLAAGRMFTSGEDRGAARVAVLGWNVVRELGYASPAPLIGQRVRIAGRSFSVIGALSPKDRSETGGDPDLQVLIPLRAGRYRLFGTDRLNDIYVLASSEADVPLAMTEIQSVLRRLHRTPADASDDFRIRNQSDFLTAISESTEVFTYLLAGIAGVSLLVGGVGIMNIMLVSVTERTREIGIRRALGARRGTILTQFLIEAVAICLLGGAIGVAAGGGILIVLRECFGWSAVIAPQAIVGGILFAAIVGIAFGVWPARRASSLDPITALRYE